MGKKSNVRKRNEGRLKDYLMRETIPYIKQIMTNAAQNEHDMIYKTHLKNVNNVSRELRECILGLMVKIYDLEL